MRSVYVVGGTGSGKSTFVGSVLAGLDLGPVEELHSIRNTNSRPTLRGHRLPRGGVYLGLMRDEYPGTDGLANTTHRVGAEWLTLDHGFEWIIGEGNTLGKSSFLQPLHQYTDLLLVHLETDEFIRDIWLHGRGAQVSQKFSGYTASSARNRAAEMRAVQCQVVELDASDPEQVEQTLHVVRQHLGIEDTVVGSD